MVTKYLESSLREEDAVYSEDVPAGEGWMHLIKKGQIFRILDLEGNQAVDTLFISATNPEVCSKLCNVRRIVWWVSARSSIQMTTIRCLPLLRIPAAITIR